MSSEDLEPGTILNGRYQIVRRLDHGKLSAVYLAIDLRLGTQFTVEEFSGADLDEAQLEQAIADFSREMQFLSQLRHPSIPYIHDWSYDESLRRFYVMTEYVSGESLASRLQSSANGRLDEKSVTEWAIQVAGALDYLHTQPKPIIYQNVKPTKIIIDDKTNRVVLINSGIAHWLKQEGKGTVGTMGYAPPELFDGRVEPRSDVYSLGATMFRVLTGVDPQDEPLLIFDFTKNLRPCQITPSISPEIERIIMRTVEYLPGDRPNAGELRDELTKHLEAEQREECDPPANTAGYVQFCVFCGARIVSADAPCSNCGHSQVDRNTAVIPEQPDQTHEKPIYLDENVQFTVYRPAKIKPAKWYPLLAYAHLAEPRPDEPTFDPIGFIEKDASRIMADQDVKVYRRASEDSLVAIPRQGEISFVPFIAGVEFNPPSSSFFWEESVHRQEFRMRASPALDGKTARGRLSVFLGTILLAEINLSVQVTSIQPDLEQDHLQQEKPAYPYRKIFPSYSHKDREIVAQLEHYAQMTGDKYMRDVFELRSGQNWKEWMAETISAADIFQLFWSTNSMHSENVKLEWQYALDLKRKNFIRPTYWETPLPESAAHNLPPPELKDLHFQHVRPPRLTHREEDSSDEEGESPIVSKPVLSSDDVPVGYLKPPAERRAPIPPPLSWEGRSPPASHDAADPAPQASRAGCLPPMSANLILWTLVALGVMAVVGILIIIFLAQG